MKAADWNRDNPVGTLVHYFPIGGQPDYRETRTRSEAWDLDCGYALVKVEGLVGGVVLEHLRVVR